MTPREAVALLAATFLPTKNLGRPTVEIYAKQLEAIDGELLAKTVQRVIETSQFFPTVALMRKTAADLAGLIPISAEEAVAVVRQADVARPVYRLDGSLAYTEHEWHWPENISWHSLGVIRAALAKCGDSRDDSGERIFGWEQSFKETFKREAETVVGEMDLRDKKPLPPAPKFRALTAEPPRPSVPGSPKALDIVMRVASGELTQEEGHRLLREIFGE